MTPAPFPVPQPPAPDLPVDAARVRSLLGRLEPGPGIDLGQVRWSLGQAPLGAGWDNELWPVGTLDGECLVLRVVRRRSALALMRGEVVVMRHVLASVGDLPLRVPVPLATTKGATLLPWVPGPLAAEADAASRRRTAGHLARTLALVHSLEAPSIEPNPVRGVPLASRTEAFSRDLGRAGVNRAQGEVAEEFWARGLEAPLWSGAALLLHGDPHPGNVLAPDPGSPGPSGTGGEHRGALIDWGDTTTGDPASDLGALLLHDPGGAVTETYRRNAGWRGIEADEIWDPLLERAAAWGARMALALLTAYDPEQPLGRAARRYLDR